MLWWISAASLLLLMQSSWTGCVLSFHSESRSAALVILHQVDELALVELALLVTAGERDRLVLHADSHVSTLFHIDTTSSKQMTRSPTKTVVVPVPEPRGHSQEAEKPVE